MAQKKITDLQLIDEVTGTLNFPSDDTLQSYRATASQIKDYILAAGNVPRTALAVGAVARKTVVSKTANYTLDATDDVVIADGTGGAFALTLPTAVGITGKYYYFDRSDLTLNAVTITPNGSETIDGASSILLSRSLIVFSDGANWKISSVFTNRQRSILSTRAGFGSTNTLIPYFTNTDLSETIGPAILTVANSSTLGASFTALRPCLVTMMYSFSHSSTGEAGGISLNAAGGQLTTVGQYSAAGALVRKSPTHSNSSIGLITSTATLVMIPGDVLRPHSNNPINLGTASQWQVEVTAIAI